MRNLLHNWDEIESDHPVPLLHRQVITGDKILLAMVHLEPGCKVALHHHESEQIAYVLSGLVRWGIGEPGLQNARSSTCEAVKCFTYLQTSLTKLRLLKTRESSICSRHLDRWESMLRRKPKPERPAYLDLTVLFPLFSSGLGAVACITR
jgi:hypothetical protein